MSALPNTGPSDDELTRRIRAGDGSAFDELYRRYAAPLTAYAGRILRDRTAGEDVAQTALMNAYQALGRGSAPEHARAWLYRIARNAALESQAKRGDVVQLADDRVSTEDQLGVRAELVAAVRTLPERQRAVFVLRELQGLRIGEIAAQLGLETEQVEQALFAARNKLAEHLAFGDRLDCATVRDLDAARLGRAEKRAVKSHLRTCSSCRSARGRSGLGLVTVPLEWLRQVLLGLLGGGAAKAAAVVATVAVVASLPSVTRQRVELPPAKTPVPAARPVRAAPVVHGEPRTPTSNPKPVVHAALVRVVTPYRRPAPTEEPTVAVRTRQAPPPAEPAPAPAREPIAEAPAPTPTREPVRTPIAVVEERTAPDTQPVARRR